MARRVDISGGQIRFADGFIDTDAGRPPTASSTTIANRGSEPHLRRDRRRIREVPSALGGVTEVFSGFGVSPGRALRAGLIEGKDAGTLSIRAYDALLDGAFLGRPWRACIRRDPAQAARGGVALFNRPYTQTPWADV
jgi:hypothetical protein